MPFDERSFIAQVEAADAQEFGEILKQPSIDEERALRAHFGDERFMSLQRLALQSSATRSRAGDRGNVVVLHGIMGSELAEGDRRIWVHVLRLVMGRFDRLKLRPDGRTQNDIRPTGLMKNYYGDQLLALSANWNVHGFAYDWRLNIEESAKRLKDSIDEWFGPNAPVHLVAHSMGGLVSRTFIRMFPERWEKAWDGDGRGKRGGRLVMLGTPNLGSYAIPHLYLGLNDMLGKLAIIDVRHTQDELMNVIESFVGTYEMLPSPLAADVPGLFYDPSTYAVSGELHSRFVLARKFHEDLAPVVDPKRMIYIAGYGQPTVVGLQKGRDARNLESYTITREGDGTVPHALGFLQTPGRERVPTYFVNQEHGALPNDARVIAAVEELFTRGETAKLPVHVPASAVRGDAEAEYIQRKRAEVDRIAHAAATLRSRGVGDDAPTVSRAEREVTNMLLSGFVATAQRPMAAAAGAGAATSTSVAVSAGGATATGTAVPLPEAKIRLRLVHGRIDDRGIVEAGDPIIDAIAVGHYMGVRPTSSELAIDNALDHAISPNGGQGGPITNFVDRGLYRGELGQPLIIPDPRDTAPGGRHRVIAIAGMGLPGRFGSAELKVLARELVWSLGRIGCQHLATVVIGAGAGNLEPGQAINAWLRGTARALRDSVSSGENALTAITFIEYDPIKVVEIDRALSGLAKAISSPSQVALDYEPLSAEEIAAVKNAPPPLPTERARGEDVIEDETPTRLTVEFEGRGYRFGALTLDAALPERTVPLNAALVQDGIERLTSAATPAEQEEWGKYLCQLLLPADLREPLQGEAPLVISCDNACARVPWEMLPQPVSDSVMPCGPLTPEERFLGLRRGLTRQLKTQFARLPEPPPPAARKLRVLVVADPSEESPLEGARKEGELVMRLVEQYNRDRAPITGDTIEARLLLGPAQATPATVLNELMKQRYDILHYSGHCCYNSEDPSLSGWIFSLRRSGASETLVVGPNELRRIDRIPRFVFSNACESGVMPDRIELRTVELAPTFAESFFERGVANFVCTAWPVGDGAALKFAEVFYSNLLGLNGEAQPIYVAMREARRAIQHFGDNGWDADYRTWGAYQHYGNPNLRFFRR